MRPEFGQKLDKNQRWLKRLEKPLGWIAIPNLAVIVITLQALGFLFLLNNPIWAMRLALLPHAALHGEYWRVVTFLALPLSPSPVWMFFVLWFLYFILNQLEAEWGAFRLTFYVLVSWALTVAYSLTFDYPVLQIGHFESTLFLAAAALFQEQEIRVFFAIPVKIKWLAWLTGVMVLYEFFRGEWLDRFYLLSIYAGFLLFFGPSATAQIRLAYRRWDYRRKIR